jgi:hypothetical protein
MLPKDAGAAGWPGDRGEAPYSAAQRCSNSRLSAYKAHNPAPIFKAGRLRAPERLAGLAFGLDEIEAEVLDLEAAE